MWQVEQCRFGLSFPPVNGHTLKEEELCILAREAPYDKLSCEGSKIFLGVEHSRFRAWLCRFQGSRSWFGRAQPLAYLGAEVRVPKNV